MIAKAKTYSAALSECFKNIKIIRISIKNKKFFLTNYKTF